MREFEHANRSGQQRGGELVPEERNACITVLDIAQHAGHDAPPIEGATVGRHRVLASRAADDIRRGLPAHHFDRARLKRMFGDGHGRRSSADAVKVDLRLPLCAHHGAVPRPMKRLLNAGVITESRCRVRRFSRGTTGPRNTRRGRRNRDTAHRRGTDPWQASRRR